MLWPAEWVYLLSDGTLIEGRGIQPDLVIEGDWSLFEMDDDPQTQAAGRVLCDE